MRNLHEIVNLRTGADDRVVDAASIDTAVGANLHVGFEYTTPNVWNTRGTVGTRDKSKPFTPHARTSVQDHPVAKIDVRIQHGTRMQSHILTQRTLRTNDRRRANPTPSANDRAILHDGVGLDRHPVGHLRGGRDDRCWMNAAGARFRAMKTRQQRHHGFRRFVHDDARSRSAGEIGQRRRHQHYAGARLLKPRGVSRVREKTQLVCLGTIEGRDTAHDNVWIANETTTRLLGNGSGGDGPRPITAVCARGRRLARHSVGGFLVESPAGVVAGPAAGFAGSLGADNRNFEITRSVMSRFLSADTINEPAATSKMKE